MAIWGKGLVVVGVGVLGYEVVFGGGGMGVEILAGA